MGRRQPFFLALWIFALTSATASAQTLGRTEVLLFSGDDRQMVPLLVVNETTRSSSARMDYATFAYELVAFVMKEILPDSRDEYPESPLGSRLSRDMTERDSDFGKHCLTVVSQVGAALPLLSRSPDLTIGPPSGFDYLRGAASTAIALRQVWSAFKNDVEGNRRGFSLNPKVGANRVGVSLTLHW